MCVHNCVARSGSAFMTNCSVATMDSHNLQSKELPNQSPCSLEHDKFEYFNFNLCMMTLKTDGRSTFNVQTVTWICWQKCKCMWHCNEKLITHWWNNWRNFPVVNKLVLPPDMLVWHELQCFMYNFVGSFGIDAEPCG